MLCLVYLGLVSTYSVTFPPIHCFLQAFGLPTTVAHVDGKTYMLFGSDRMELLAYLLGKFRFSFPLPFDPSPTPIVSHAHNSYNKRFWYF